VSNDDFTPLTPEAIESMVHNANDALNSWAPVHDQMVQHRLANHVLDLVQHLSWMRDIHARTAAKAAMDAFEQAVKAHNEQVGAR
jgi:hypothetical protein